MPSIPIYNAPTTPIEIPNRGVEALATAGRRLGQLGNETASATREGGRALETGLDEAGRAIDVIQAKSKAIEGQQDVVGVSSVAASLQNSLAQQWQQVQSSGHPENAQKFLSEVVQPELDQLSDAAQTDAGRKYASEQAAALNMHWGERVTVGQAQMAGAAAVSNLNTVHDNLTAAVVADPSHLSQAMNQLKSTYEAAAASSGSAETAGRIRDTMQPAAVKDLLTAGGKAVIDNAIKNNQDPNVAIAKYNKVYGDQLGGDRMQQLATVADNRLKLYKADQKLTAQNDALVAQTNSDTQVPQLFTHVLGGLQAGTHTLPTDVMNQVNESPNLTTATKSAFNAATGKIANGTAATATAPDVLDDAVTGRLVPAGQKGSITPTMLLNGVAHGDISAADAHFLMTAPPEAISHVNSALEFGRSYLAPTDPGTNKPDPVRSVQYGQYQKWVMEKASAGVLPDVSQLQTMVPAFKGYTVGAGPQGPVAQWGTPPGFLSGVETGIGQAFHAVTNAVAGNGQSAKAPVPPRPGAPPPSIGSYLGLK